MIIRVDNNPREMNQRENQYWRHVLSGDPMFKNFLSRQASFGNNPYQEASSQVVCEKCERVCFFHKNGVICSHCGHFSTNNSHTFKKHLKEGYYKS